MDTFLAHAGLPAGRQPHLNENWFETLAQAREVIALWRQDYNEVRPHESI
ncbi:integrase core domain-containing protein [Paracidovorax citrulli]